MIFRQLFDQTSATFTYLLGDERTGKAVLIDCVFEQHLRDLALVRELGLELVATLETHVHADHVTGAWLMKQATGSQIWLAEAAETACADRALRPGEVVHAGDLAIEVRATPGHTSGCLSFVVEKERMVFTGDALLIRGAGRTDFQQGDAGLLFRSVREQLFTLPLDFAIYPAHDYNGRSSSTVGEERQHNPRLGDGVAEEDFSGYMRNLGLPHPNKLAIAVPANLRCGEPQGETASPTHPSWGPVARSFAGVWQIEPEWVYEHKDDVRVVDVREHAELEVGELGSIPGAELLPLSELRARVAALGGERPVVFVCPAGARSAIAATILEQSGQQAVASLRGGLRAWSALGLPLATER